MIMEYLTGEVPRTHRDTHPVGCLSVGGAAWPAEHPQG